MENDQNKRYGYVVGYKKNPEDEDIWFFKHHKVVTMDDCLPFIIEKNKIYTLKKESSFYLSSFGFPYFTSLEDDIIKYFNFMETTSIYLYLDYRPYIFKIEILGKEKSKRYRKDFLDLEIWFTDKFKIIEEVPFNYFRELIDEKCIYNDEGYLLKIKKGDGCIEYMRDEVNRILEEKHKDYIKKCYYYSTGELKKEEMIIDDKICVSDLYYENGSMQKHEINKNSIELIIEDHIDLDKK